jgi:hypothetical protein
MVDKKLYFLTTGYIAIFQGWNAKKYHPHYRENPLLDFLNKARKEMPGEFNIFLQANRIQNINNPDA